MLLQTTHFFGEDDTEEILVLTKPGAARKKPGVNRKMSGAGNNKAGANSENNKKKKSKDKFTVDDYFKRTPSLKTKAVQPTFSDASSVGCPFVLKETKTHCRDLTAIVNKIKGNSAAGKCTESSLTGWNFVAILE